MDKAEFHTRLAAIAHEIPLHVLDKLDSLMDEYVTALLDMEGNLIEVSKQMGALAVVDAMHLTFQDVLLNIDPPENYPEDQDPLDVWEEIPPDA